MCINSVQCIISSWYFILKTERDERICDIERKNFTVTLLRVLQTAFIYRLRYLYQKDILSI